MNFQQTFDIEYKKQLDINLERIYIDTLNNDKDTLDKLKRHAHKYNDTIDNIKNAIIERNTWALRLFAIDPGRQNISEIIQAQYNNINRLPTRNPHKWTDGEAWTKTIDGILDDYFIFMKVIRQHGGQQEDVKREAEEFIRIIQKDPKAIDQKFIILIDDFTKPCLNRYKAFVKSENIKVMNSDELKGMK